MSKVAFRVVLTLTALCGALGCATPATDFDCDGGCEVVCRMPGQWCQDEASCCPGLSCANGVCACFAEGEQCSPTGERCCTGLSCDGTGHCRPACAVEVGACQPFGGACSGDGGNECCSTAECNGGKCVDPAIGLGCVPEGAACTTGADCCGKVAVGSRLDCLQGSDGGRFCHFGQAGEACDTTRHCSPGLGCLYPPDGGNSDGGADDGGVDDGGVDDGGTADAGAIDAGVPVGSCGPFKTNRTCTLNSASCSLGDACNPDSSTNQGYDPCFFLVSGGYLDYRTTVLLCTGGVCGLPGEGDPCSSGCLQTAGDPRRTACLSGYNGSGLCMPACSGDSDCRGAGVYDSSVYSPQRITNYCVNYNGGSGCQPALCFVEGDKTYGNTDVLYKPCQDHPGSICLPRYSGVDSTILGFCTAARATTTPTVGQACDPRAGREANAALCGNDATCLGGRCAAICDAAALGLKGTPVCEKGLTCISPQGLDLVSDLQFGGCADPCDPFSDLEHSGCVNYCGGPPARCNWIIADPLQGVPRGYCGAAIPAALKHGQECKTAAVNPCESGDYCLVAADGVTRTCTRLCDPTATAGAPDACPAGLTCTGFTSFKRSGYCK